MDQILADLLTEIIKAVPWAGVLIIVGLLFWPKFIDLLTKWLDASEKRWQTIGEAITLNTEHLARLDSTMNIRQAQTSNDIKQLVAVLSDQTDDIRALVMHVASGSRGYGADVSAVPSSDAGRIDPTKTDRPFGSGA